MARRKNTRRFDPRYFMNEKVEHTSPILNENQQGPLMPFLTGQGDPSRLEGLKGYQIGNIDLAAFVRDWNSEVLNFSAESNLPSGTPSNKIAAAYMEKNPKRADAFNYLKSIVQKFDEYSAASQKAIDAREDVSAVYNTYIKKYGSEFTKAQKQLPTLFGDAGARQKRAAVAKTRSRDQAAAAQDRMRQANTDARRAPQQSFEEAQQIDELGIGTALRGLGGAIKGKAFDKVKGMKGPVAQDVQAQKQIQRIVADMVKKDPNSAALYAQFLTKLAQSIAPAKTGEAGF